MLQQSQRHGEFDLLGEAERQQLFSEHLGHIYQTRLQAFYSCLDSRKLPLAVATWDEVAALVCDDPRVTRLSSSSAELSHEFQTYHRERMARARDELRSLISENHLLKFHAQNNALDALKMDDIHQVLKVIPTRPAEARVQWQLLHRPTSGTCSSTVCRRSVQL